MRIERLEEAIGDNVGVIPKANCPMTLPMFAPAFMKPSRWGGRELPP